MPLSTETIANKPLKGDELIEIAVNAFRDQLKRDCYFLPNLTYRRVSFSLKATFHLSELLPAHEISVRGPKTGVLEGEPPLKLEEGDDSLVIGLERDVEVANPNLARVHNDLPITVQVKKPQGPGEMFPAFEDKKLLYDKGEYPAEKAPVDRDVSEQKAKELGVPSRRARRKQETELKYDAGDLAETSNRR